MADFGLTDEGFNKKRQADILIEINTNQLDIFGENFNVSPQSPDGQINGVISGTFADLWDIAEESFNAFNPSTATGDALSNLVQLNGITRLPATASTATLDITGVDTTVIPEGSLVETFDSNTRFSTDNEVTITGGVATVACTAVNTGALQADINTITTIVNPVTGWTTVTNPAEANEGNDKETDSELRARRESTFGLASQAIIDSIFAGLSVLPGVDGVTVLENDTDIVDLNGLPAHSFECIVSGGVDSIIANSIYSRKPVGIRAFGVTTVPVEDSQGFNHSISFTRPTEIDIYITLNLTTNENYPTNGDDIIKQAIVDYANGDLVSGREFSVGDDVILSRLYTPINTVQGHTVDSLFINDTGLPAAGITDIAIGVKELSTFDVLNIEINTA